MVSAPIRQRACADFICLKLLRRAARCIVRMRHAEPLIKVSRQIRTFAEQDRWRGAAQASAIPDEVGLIVVAAIDGGLHPIDTAPPDGAEHIVESLNAAKQFGRKSDRGLEAPLKLPGA